MCVALILASVLNAQAQTEAIAAAVKAANPAFIQDLSKAIGGSPEQAVGAAGALFGLAKSRLRPEEFARVQSAVPGMDSILKAAPVLDNPVGTTGALSKMTGLASGLGTATSAFTKLGLKPEMVSQAIPVLTGFVTKSGGEVAGNILASALR
jgi:hypothetical protein